jgi:hypothetical protein
VAVINAWEWFEPEISRKIFRKGWIIAQDIRQIALYTPTCGPSIGPAPHTPVRGFFILYKCSTITLYLLTPYAKIARFDKIGSQ